MEHQAQYSDLLQLSKELDHIYHEVSLKMGLSDSGFSLLYALCERGVPTPLPPNSTPSGPSPSRRAIPP